MKQNMMRIAIAAAFGLTAVAAQANQIGVNVGATLGSEYITAAAKLVQPSVTYQFSNVINGNSTVYFVVHIDNGTFASIPAGAVLAAGTGLVTGVAAALDTSTYYVPVTAAPTGGVLNSNITFTGGAAAGEITNATALTVGGSGKVNVTVGYTTTLPTTYAGINFVEGTNSGVLLTSASALSTIVLSSAVMGSNAAVLVSDPAAKNVTAKVDIKTPAAILKQFADNASSTNPADTVNLGYMKLKVNTTLANGAGGTAAVADFGDLSATVTGDFSAAVAPVVSVSTKADCSAALGAPVAIAIAADGKSAKITGITAAQANTGGFVCYAIDNTKTIVAPTQYVLGAIDVAASTAGAADTAASTQAGGDLYKLVTNGASVFVPSFVPSIGAVGTTGYNTYLRIVNTGNQTADISGFGYNQTTGVAGTPAVIAPALAPNASVVLSTDAVTSALGLAAGWSSLQVTGGTSDLAVQPLLVNPQGVITNIGGANK